MKPRPLLRSMTFWLGLPGLLFLLWSWHDSLTHQAGIFRPLSVAYPGRVNSVEDRIVHAHSGWLIDAYELEPAPNRTISAGSPALERREIPPALQPSPLFPSFHFSSIKNVFPATDGLHVRRGFIPHWMILFSYGSTWSCLLLWRARRIRKATLRRS